MTIKNADAVMGVNINCKMYDFIGWILSSDENVRKTVETRKTASLRPYVGKCVGLVRTGRGKAVLVGYATITEEVVYNSAEEFDADFDRHRVAKDSSYHKSSGFGYVFADIEACEPRQIASKGIVARKLIFG